MATNQYLLAPKKPVNTFFHFQRDKMLEMMHANPGKKPSEIMPLLSEAYKNLSITERKKYEDLATADRERYFKECQKYSKKCKIPAPKRLNSLPTDDDDDEEFKENPPKKMKGNKAKDNKKDNKKGTKKVTNHKENRIIFEDAAGSRPGPNPNNPNVRRNSLNQICFVRIDELTGKEILVPGVYILNEMVDSIPGSVLTPEIWHRIEAARQKDKETLENAKRINAFDLIWE